MTDRSRLPLSLRLASRALRRGVRGFGIFLACLALGVGAIAAAGSTAAAFRAGLAHEAGAILGGDLAVGVEQREFTPAERAGLERLGSVDYAAASRAMAAAPSGARRLVVLRGVSANYPLIGEVTLEGGVPLADALKPGAGAAGVAVEPALLARLGLKLGEPFTIGDTRVVARAILLNEPDRLSRGFALGPRVLAPISVLRQGGFLAPGLAFGETARIALRPGLSLAAAKRTIARILPPNGYVVRDRTDAAPGYQRLIDRLEYFLGLIGLASLAAGGLGVWSAVDAYLEREKPAIAVLKALGAEGALTRNLYLAQVGALAALGVVIGLAAGAATPFALDALLPRDFPAPALFAVYPVPLAKAALFGLLAAAAFSLAPLGAARATPAASLLRQETSRRPALGSELAGAVLAGAGLLALAVLAAPDPPTAAALICGAAAGFAGLVGLGHGAALAARGGRRIGRGALRIGLANLSGPRSAARTAAPAIGLGVALLTATVLIQSSLIAEATLAAPREAPSLVFTEIPPGQGPAFDQAVARAFGRPLTSAKYRRYAFATGRIVALNGAPVDKAKIAPRGRWAFDSDIDLSAIGAEPEGADVTSGRWWPAAYDGPPLVALDEQVAKAAGLKAGDRLTLSVLGRDIETRVAALRKVSFGRFGPAFTLVVDPEALAGANLRSVAIARASPAESARVIRDLAGAFPMVNVIDIRAQLAAAADLFRRAGLAIRGAAGVVALASLLVLVGAVAASARERTKAAAILKVLGASRAQVLAAYGAEYAAVGVLAGVAGAALGAAAAWPVVTLVIRAPWSVDWSGTIWLVAGAAVAALLGGIAAALGALSRRPAPVLRAE